MMCIMALRIASVGPVCSPAEHSPHFSVPMHRSGKEGHAFASLSAFACDALGVLFVCGLTYNEVIASIPEGSSPPAPFVGMTLAPLAYPSGRKDAIIALSRERYARPRATVEPRIRALFPDFDAGKSPP